MQFETAFANLYHNMAHDSRRDLKDTRVRGRGRKVFRKVVGVSNYGLLGYSPRP
jgi:hypothetical protein